MVHPPWKITLSLQPYDFTFKYIPGQKVPAAEASSYKTEIKGLDITIHDVATTLNHVQVEAIQKAATDNQVLQLLMQQIMPVCPDYIKQLPEVLKPFWQLRDDLSIEHSCVTFQ